ncbi:MAG: hypothetical protein M3552_23040 [Planctomycetota bacterium]|nr:hypothetical protein [Planctomycetaceae bacterium]MDQ3333484.1 hypothetical protein [Planctomycetota bacterium]
MSDVILARSVFALFVTALVSLALAGHPRLQATVLTITFAASGVIAVGIHRLPASHGFARLFGYAIVFCLAFALWNLVGQPNERWAHRTFIYTCYGAAAAIVLLASALDKPQGLSNTDWLVTAGIYLASTITIASIKPCFVERMMAAVA